MGAAAACSSWSHEVGETQACRGLRQMERCCRRADPTEEARDCSNVPMAAAAAINSMESVAIYCRGEEETDEACSARIDADGASAIGTSIRIMEVHSREAE